MKIPARVSETRSWVYPTQ